MTEIEFPERISYPTLRQRKNDGYLSLNNHMIDEMEAFVEEKEDERKLRFYKSPRLRQFWGEEQEELEIWKELFFDLIYVAVAFNFGGTIEEQIIKNEGFTGYLYFLGQFLPLYTSWWVRTLYLSEFNSTSYFHGFLDVIYALHIALMAIFIASKNEIEESIGKGLSDSTLTGNATFFRILAETTVGPLGYNTALGYSATALIGASINVFLCLEMIFVVSKKGIRHDVSDKMRKRQNLAIKTQGRVNLMRVLLYMFCMTLSLIGAITGNTTLFLVPLFAEFIMSILLQLVIRVVWQSCFKKKLEMVPMNVGFVIKRLGEFAMLMLGEGVLQIIIAPVNSDDFDGHFETFVLAFLVQACIFVLFFYGLPFEAEEHAFRKSSVSGLIITLVNPLGFSSIIGVGVGLKQTLKNEDRLADITDSTKKTTVVFLSLSVSIIIILRLINHGYKEIVKKNDTINFKRIIFSILWIMSPLLFECLRDAKLNGPAFLLSILGIFIIIFIMGIYEFKVFVKESEGEHKKENLFGVSQAIQDHYMKPSTQISSHVVISSHGTNRRANMYNVTNMLQYLRKKTRKIAGKVNIANELGRNEYRWEEDVEDMEQLLALIKDTFKEADRTAMKKQGIKAMEEEATL